MLLNFAISLTLYIYTYSLGGLLSGGIYLGALVLLLIHFMTGNYFFNLFREG